MSRILNLFLAIINVACLLVACNDNSQEEVRPPASGPILYQKFDIDQFVDQKITSRHNYEAIVMEVLGKHASFYRSEAVERLQRFLLATEDLAKGRDSLLIKNLNYYVDLPQFPREISVSDDVVIILDAGFSDTVLTYAKDVVAYYVMGDDGRLNEQPMELVIPRWYWYLYELLSDAGAPFRIMGEIIKKAPKVKMPYSNMVRNYNLFDLGWDDYINESGQIVFDSQASIDSKYHGAMVAYILKEWAPSTKMILVRYDMQQTCPEKELQMLNDLDKIVRKYNADIIVRSSTGSHHWHRLDQNENLLKDPLLIGGGLYIPGFKSDYERLSDLAQSRNYVLANTFSTGCSGVEIEARGNSRSEISIQDIAEFSFYDDIEFNRIRENSSFFINRHICSHYCNPFLEHDSCIKDFPFFPIGFRGDGDPKRPHELKISRLRGDSSSAAPLAAAWSLFIKAHNEIEKIDQSNVMALKRFLEGWRIPNQRKPNIFQDPIKFSQFPIFDEGYGDNLIIPKKLTDY